MKKVEAIIRPSKLKAIQKGLKNIDIPCITVIPVSGTGLQKSYTKMYRGTEQSLALQNRTMITCPSEPNSKIVSTHFSKFSSLITQIIIVLFCNANDCSVPRYIFV